MRSTKLLIVILVSLILQNCKDGKTPVINDIVGKWVSVDDAIIEFKPDGSFIGINLPSNLLKASDINEKRFDCNGEWIIKQSKKDWDQLPWYISLKINEAKTKYVSATYLSVSGSNFLENSPPWRYLFFWEGEVGGKRYKFEKKI